MSHVDRALTADETAGILGVSPRSILDPRYRRRIKLAATRVGRSVRFRMSDVEGVLKRGREKVPVMPEEDANAVAD
jgi:hypothetical protein